MKININ